ncbi:LysM peptidoglycan-binding domain-containing protein [Duganella sp. Root336D2]|uniref:LysM peptidoglycan-binding domain-containing protein n=1 Tax=Duganella sp. Root336D2 TaxID=1736518 RepID=UPI0006F35702|nr:LysM peptidoglycan-binding domain-containing protein [Duganella sp. Root336D2]
MVAIVSGNGVGISNTSAGTLGQSGVFGNSANGNAKDSVYINVANGNLLLQDRDDCIVARGIDMEVVRTYNSQGLFNGADGSGWRQGLRKQVNGLTGTVNTAGSTITRTDGDGSITVFTYDAARAAYVSTDGGGAYQTLVFNSATNRWTWQADHNDQLGIYEIYDGVTGLIESKADHRYGVSFTYTYDSNQQLAKVRDARGDETYFDYLNGNVSKIRTVLAGTTGDFSRVSYQYDTSNRLASVITDLTPENQADAKTYTVSYTYLGTSSQVETVTQSDGTRLTFAYVLHDGKNKVASVTDALGRKTSFDYSVGGKTTVTDHLGYKTAYAYDAKGQLVSITAPAVAGVSQITQFEYDASGNVSRTIDARGLATSYGYDANGNRILERDATGATVTRVYSSSNKLLSETRYTDIDPDGAGSLMPTQKMITRYVYDSYNLLRFVVSPEGRVQEYRYDAQLQRTVELAYIGANLADTSPESAYTFDAMLAWSQTTPVKTAAASRIDYAYDVRGMVTQTTSHAATVGAADAAPATGPDTAIVRHVYDQAGQLLQSIDGNGNTTTYTYDGLGRLLSTTDALQNSILRTYDDAGNRVVTRRADGVTSTATYDKAGQLLSTVLADISGATLGTTSYLYDNVGRLRTVTDPKGARSHILYDEAGRKAATITAAGSMTEYRYDANNQVSMTVVYASPVSQASLAALVGADGKPSVATLETAGVRPATSSADQREWRLYDNANRLVKSVDALGYVTDFAYDGASRLLDATLRATAINLSTFAANPVAANATPAASAYDRIARNGYDKDGKLRFSMDGEGYLTELRYDPAGRQISTTRYAIAVEPSPRQGAGWASTVYSSADVTTSTTYDGRGLVSSQVDGAGNATAFTYDAIGNILTSTTAGVVTRFVYDKLGRLTEKHADANGSNVTSKTAYDAQGNKIAITDAAGKTTHFVYDAYGRQVFSIDALGIVTENKYDTNGNVVGTIRYAKPIDPARINSTDNATNTFAGPNARLYGTSAAIDTGKTYKVRARLRQVSGTGAIYVGVATTDANGNQLWNSTGQNFSFPGAVNVQLTPEMGWKEFEGTVTGEYTASAGVYDANKFFAGSKNGGPVLFFNYPGTNGPDGTAKVEVDYLELVDVATGKVLNQNGQMASGTTGWVSATTVVNALSPATVRAMLTGEAGAVEYQRYDGNGRLTWAVDATGAATQIVYDAKGNVVKRIAYTEPLSASALNALAADVNALPAPSSVFSATNYVYDAGNRLVFTVDALGSVVETRYDASGHVTATLQYAKTIDPLQLGNPVTIAAVAALVAPNSALASRAFQRYDDAGRLVWSVDASGAATALVYDARGNVIERSTYSMALDAATISKLDMDPGFRPAPAGQAFTTRYVYDGADRLLFTIDPLGAVEEKRYDANGNVVQTLRYTKPINPAAVGSDNRTLSITGAAGYNLDGSVVAVDTNKTYTIRARVRQTSGRGAIYIGVTTLDAAGARMPNPSGGTPTFPYAAAFNVTLDAANGWQEFEGTISGAYSPSGGIYDFHRFFAGTKSIKPLITYNNEGVSGPDGKMGIEVDYLEFIDAATGEVLNANADMALGTTGWTGPGTQVATTDSSTRESRVRQQLGAGADCVREFKSYDALGRLTWQVDGTGAATQLSYDVKGNLVKRLEHRETLNATALAALAANPGAAPVLGGDAFSNFVSPGNTTQYVYDDDNRLVFTISPVGGITETKYDALGNVVQTVSYAASLYPQLFAGTDGRTILTASTLNSTLSGSYSAVDVNKTYTVRARVRQVSGDGTVYVGVVAKDAGGSLIVNAGGYTHNYAGGIVRLKPEMGWQTFEGKITGTFPRGVGQYDAHKFLEGTVSAAPLLLYNYGGVNGADGKATTEVDYLEFIDDATGQVLNANGTMSSGVANWSDIYGAASGAAGVNSYAVSEAQIRAMVATRADIAKDSQQFYRYDKEGRKTWSVDPSGAVTQLVCDSNGNVIKRIAYNDALGDTALAALRADPAAIPAVSAACTMTQYVYDADKRLVFTIDALGDVSETRYDAKGNVAQVLQYTKVIDSTAVGVDSVAGTREARVRSLLSGNPEVREFKSYDGSGRVLWQVDPSRTITQFAYDTRGNLVKRVVHSAALSDAAFAALVASLGSAPAVTAATAPTLTSPGSTNLYVYDADSRLIFTIDPVGAVNETRYDTLGNVVQTVRYANPIDPKQLASTDGRTLAVNSFANTAATGTYSPISTSKTYTVRARVRQVSGKGTVYVGVRTTDQNGNLLSNASGAGYSYAGGSTQLTPEMGWQSFEGKITGQYVSGVDPYDANKFIAGSVNAAPLLLFNYYGSQSVDGKRFVEIDYIELVDDATGNVLNANWKMESGVASYSGTSNTGETINSHAVSEFLVRDMLKSRVDATKDAVTFQRYDKDGRLTWSVDATGAATQFFYDSNGNMVKRLAYADRLTPSALALLAADASAIPAVTGASSMTQFVFDAANRLIFTIDANGSVTEKRYDFNNNALETVHYATPISPSAVSMTDSSTLSLWGSNTPYIVGAYTAIDTTKTYKVRLRVRQTSGEGTIYAGVMTKDANGTILKNTTADGTYSYAAGLGIRLKPSMGWQVLEGTISGEFVPGAGAYDAHKFIAGTKTAAPLLRYNFYGTPGPDGGLGIEVDYLEFIDSDGNVLNANSDMSAGTSNWTGVGSVKAVNIPAPIVPMTRQMLVADAANDTREFKRYDKNGRLAWTVDALGATTQLIYDAKGNLVSRIAYSTALSPAAMAKLAADTSAIPMPGNGFAATNYVYDDANRLVFTIDPLGAVSENRYDASGNVTETIRYATPIDPRLNKSMDGKTVTQWGLNGAHSGSTVAIDTSKTYAVRARVRQVTGSGSFYLGVVALDANKNWLTQTNAPGNPYPGANGVLLTPEMGWREFEGTITGEQLISPSSYDPNKFFQGTKFAQPLVFTNISGQVGADGTAGVEVDYIELVDVATGQVLNENSQMATGAAAWSVKNDTFNTLNVAKVSQLLQADATKDIRQRNRYDANGRLTWSIDALGSVVEHRYDAAGNLSKTIAYANGLAGTLADGAVPQVVATVPGSGAYVLSNVLDRVTSYAYDASGHLISRTDGVGTADASTQSWAYDKAGNAIRHTDGRGNTTWSAYDAANRLVRQVDAAGYVTARSYYANGQLKSETRFTNPVALPAAANDAWAYDTATNPVANTDPFKGDQTTSWTYDSAGRMQTSTDASGGVTFYAYDGLGNLTDTTVAYGTNAAATVHRVYDRASRVVTETRAYGTVDAFTTQYGYDTWGNQTTITAGGVTTNQYFDALGRKTGVKDGNQAVTTTTYNAFGDIVKVTDARGNAGYFYSDALGRVTMQVDPEGSVSETRYDLQDNVVNIIRYANKVQGTVNENTRPQVLPSAGTGVFVVQSSNDQYQNSYFDVLGRVKGTFTGSDGAAYYTETFSYDGNGNKLTMTSRNGGVTTYEYDKNNRLITETLPITSKNAANADVAVQNRLEYDARGNVVKKIEAYGLPEQRVTTYVFDKLNRQVKEIGEAINTFDATTRQDLLVTPVKEQKYDQRGNLIEEIDVRGGRTLHFFDKGNRETGRIDSLGTYTRFTYDIAGQKASQTIYANTVQVVGGGAIPNATAPVLLAPGAALPASGAYLRTDTANDRTTSFTYDNVGRLKTTVVDGITTGVFNKATNRYVVTTGSTIRTQTFYDATGNVVKTIDANGNVTRNYYNRAGRLMATLDAMRYLTVYQFDGNGNISTQATYANAIAANVVVDDNTTLPQLTLVASPDDRITNFTYDRLGRVKTESRLNVAYAVVDGNTGALTETTGTATTTYEYDGLSNVTRRTDANGAVTDWQYDKAGRKTKEQQAAFVDYRGVSVRTTTDFEYNGLNQVRREIARGENDAVENDDRITRYYYGAGGHLVSQFDGENAQIDYRVDAAGNITRKTLVGRVNADGASVNDVTYYWYDAQGRETRHTDGATNTAVETRYNAFGEISGKRTNPAPGSTEWAEFTDYDQAGRVWRSNAGDGITHMYVTDANGNTTLKLDHARTDLRNSTLASALSMVDSNQFYSVFDARNQLSDTYQPPMDGQHSIITVEQALTQKQGTSFAGVGGDVGMWVASGLNSAAAAVMPGTPGAVTIAPALFAAVTLTDRYSVATKYYEGSAFRSASHTVTVSVPDTSSWGSGAVRVDISIPASGSLMGYDGSFYPTAAAPSLTFNEPVDWESGEGAGGRDFTITFYKETASGLVQLNSQKVWRSAPGGGTTTVNASIATTGNTIRFIDQRPDTQRLVLMTRPTGSTGGWTINNASKAIVNNAYRDGCFNFDWSGMQQGSYEFRYVCFNGSNEVVNSQQGTMVLNASTPSMSQMSHTMGGAGRAFVDSGNNIVFNELGGQATSLTVSYRLPGGNWTTLDMAPSTIGGTQLPGWFTLSTAGMLAGTYEYTIEAKNGTGTTLTKSSSNFTIGSPITVNDPSGVSVQTSPLTNVSIAAMAATTRQATLYRDISSTPVYDKFGDEIYTKPNPPINSLSVQIPDTSAWGDGAVRLAVSIGGSTSSYGTYSGASGSATAPYTQNAISMYLPETLTGGGGNPSTNIWWALYKQTVNGELAVAWYSGTIMPESQTMPVQTYENWIAFDTQPTKASRMILELRGKSDLGGWTVRSVDQQWIKAAPTTGRFALNWTGWTPGTYTYRTVALDDNGNVLQTGSGEIELGSTPRVTPQTNDLIGGAGRVFMDPTGNLHFTEQGSAATKLSIRYRKKGSAELWSPRTELTPAVLGGQSTRGWFIFNPANIAEADLEYVIETRNDSNQLLNKTAGTFVKMNAGSVSALAGYSEPPVVTRFAGQPVNTANVRLSYRVKGSGAYTTVNLPKVTTGIFDWASSGVFNSDTESRDYDYIYESQDSNGVVINQAHGIVTLGRDPKIASHVKDSLPTLASFNVPANNPVAATATTLVLQYRMLGSTGAFTTKELSKNANGAFVWDASALVPPGTSGAIDYAFTLKNGSTVLKRDDGTDIKVDGVLYLGPTDGEAQLKWQETGTVSNVALIHHAQKTNAFGEVVSETNARGYTTVSVYNALGKLIRKEDPNVSVTLSNGYQQSITPKTYYYYDRAGRMLAQRDANGNLTSQAMVASSGAVTAEFHADGGIKVNGYDIFGDLRYGRDEINQRTDYSYDKNGRLTLIQRPLRTDGMRAEVSMTYDQAGNRITQAATPDASATLASYTNKTFYDSMGRVSKVVTPAGRSSNYTYEWDANIKSTGGRVVGGWRQTVGDPMGRTVIDEIDAYGRTTAHTDLGGHKFFYNFNTAGWLDSQSGTTGQNISYTYYANGYVKSIRDVALNTETAYEYDSVGNRVYESYKRTVNGQVEYLENSSVDYDSNNRVIRIRDPRADIQYEYDAVGNRRRVRSMYHDGLDGSVQVQDYWYDYDNMNRFTLTMGKLSSVNGARGTSVADTSVRVVLGDRGSEGVQVFYNKASQRKTTVAARDGHREDYTYGVEGYLEFTYINADASAQGALASMRVNDRLGRTVGYTEYTNGNISYQRSTVYTADGRQKSQTGTDGTTTYYYYTQRVGNEDSLTGISSDGAGELAKVQTEKAGAATITNVTAYDYWDDAKQRSQTVSGETPYKPDTVWRPGVSSFKYDVNGHLVQAIDVVGNVTFNYISNGQGLVLRREQFKGNTIGMIHRYMYLNGNMVGDVGNDGDAHLDYAQTLARPNQSREQMYKNWRPVSSADFDQNYQPITREYPAATGSSYTVKAGDSLYSIAGAVWGDVSMWYLIADANGLSAETELSAGQTLTIPNKVTNIHNNNGTFRPYEPGAIMGDVSPTLPDAPMPAPPPKKHGCGIVGQIIMVVVAVVVTAMTGGAAAAFFGSQILGAMAGAALGSIASQAVGIAIGAQEKFNWKSVAISAVSAGVTSGVSSYLDPSAASMAAGASPGFGEALSGQGWTAVAGRAVLSNVASQATANVLGLQKGFNWSSVAVSAISAPITSKISEKIGSSDWANANSALRIFATSTASAVVSAATRVAVVGGRMSWEAVAVDAVSNALGSSFAELFDSDRELNGARARSTARARARGEAMPVIDALPMEPIPTPGLADAINNLPRVPSELDEFKLSFKEASKLQIENDAAAVAGIAEEFSAGDKARAARQSALIRKSLASLPPPPAFTIGGEARQYSDAAQSNGQLFTSEDIQYMERMFKGELGGGSGAASGALLSLRMNGMQPSPFGADPYHGPVDVRGGPESMLSIFNPAERTIDPKITSRGTALKMDFAPVGIQYYDKTDPTYHEYTMDVVLCYRSQPFCTIPQVAPYVDYNSAPKMGWDGLWNGFEKMESGPQNLIGGDPIIHSADLEKGKFINQTQKAHRFHPGAVESDLYWKNDELHLQTVGYGYAKSTLHKPFNYGIGEVYFGLWQQSLRTQIQGINSTLNALNQRKE